MKSTPYCAWCHPEHKPAADGSESTGMCREHLLQLRLELRLLKFRDYMASRMDSVRGALILFKTISRRHRKP